MERGSKDYFFLENRGEWKKKNKEKQSTLRPKLKL